MNIIINFPTDSQLKGHKLQDYQAFITQATIQKQISGEEVEEYKTYLFLIGSSSIMLLNGEDTSILYNETFQSSDQTIEETFTSRTDWLYGDFIRALKPEDFSLIATIEYNWLSMLNSLDDHVDDVIEKLQALQAPENEIIYKDSYIKCEEELGKLKILTDEIAQETGNIVDKVSDLYRQEVINKANDLKGEVEKITLSDNVTDITDSELTALLPQIETSITKANEFKTFVNDCAETIVFEEEETIEEEAPEEEPTEII